jgi:hypothetical protein
MSKKQKPPKPQKQPSRRFVITYVDPHSGAVAGNYVDPREAGRIERSIIARDNLHTFLSGHNGATPDPTAAVEAERQRLNREALESYLARHNGAAGSNQSFADLQSRNLELRDFRRTIQQSEDTLRAANDPPPRFHNPDLEARVAALEEAVAGLMTPASPAPEPTDA